MPVTKSIQKPVSSSRKKTDEQLFEFLNSGPSSLGTAEKRVPQFTSTPVKQKSSQIAQQPDDHTGVAQTSEKSISADKGEFQCIDTSCPQIHIMCSTVHWSAFLIFV